jgi:hypothetical protein
MLPRLQIKLKGRHFATVQLMEAELQVVLNTLTEHYIQDTFNNSRSSENGAEA